MTKDVLVSISGLHQDAISDLPDEENEPIEVVTPASYYCKNGKHYVIYDELMEGESQTHIWFLKKTGRILLITRLRMVRCLWV